jgi:hypothetical protein
MEPEAFSGMAAKIKFSPVHITVFCPSGMVNPPPP